MALSLGDMALAFAGGAAEQTNKIIDEEREAKTRMQERAQDLQDQMAVKQAETDYTNEVNSHQKRAALRDSLKSVGGPQTPLGQQLIAEYNGLDLASAVKSKQFGKLSAPEVGDSPIPLTERAARLSSSKYTPEKLGFANRVRSTLLGKKYNANGGGIPAGVVPDRNGNIRPEDLVRSAGLDVDDPAAFVSNMDGMSEEQWELTGKLMTGELDKTKWQYDTDLKSWVGINEKTGATALSAIDGIPEGQGIPDKENLFTLQEERVRWEGKLNDGDSPEEAKRRIAEIDARINNLSKANIDLEAQDNLKLRNARHLQELTNKASAVDTALASLDAYERTSTEQQGGVAGFFTAFRDLVGTQIRGVSDLMGTTEPLNMAQKREAMEAAGLNYDDFVSENAGIYRGMNEAERVNMFYTIASMFKETGRRDLSNQDIQRGKDLLAGMEGSAGRQGALISLRRMITERKAEVNLAVYESEGISQQQKVRAGEAFLATKRTRDGKPMQRNVNYIIVDGVIGIRQGENGIVSLDEFLANNPAARR